MNIEGFDSSKIINLHARISNNPNQEMHFLQGEKINLHSVFIKLTGVDSITEPKTAFDFKIDHDVIQSHLFKAAIGFKYLDTGIDAARMLYIPTIDNIKSFVTDATYLHSMYVGINGASTIINGIGVAAKLYNGEVEQALTQSLTTIAYMVVPEAIAFTGIPYAGFAYGAGLTIFAGYSAITNGYALYQEYYEENSELKSAEAYENLFESLSGYIPTFDESPEL
jgi:hypothetical protein